MSIGGVQAALGSTVQGLTRRASCGCQCRAQQPKLFEKQCTCELVVHVKRCVETQSFSLTFVSTVLHWWYHGWKSDKDRVSGRSERSVELAGQSKSTIGCHRGNMVEYDVAQNKFDQ